MGEDPKQAVLYLEDGSHFEGFSFGAEVSVAGECVFQTGMVGYPEALTDPSYHGQLLVLTFPLIGNYGVPGDDLDPETGILRFFESNKIHAAALIVAEYCDTPSHWNCKKTLSQWLKEHGVPAISGVDTRALTQKIRDSGSMLGKLVIENKDVPFEDPNKRNLVAEVTIKEPKVYGNGSKTVLMVDCGMKYNQLRCLLKRNLKVKLVPYDHDISAEKDLDGVFVTNGPGDPSLCTQTIQQLKLLIERPNPVPIFGICMGHQLLSLAAGAKSYKMKFGNRGHNQPCQDLFSNGRCYLTSQNHGFAIDTSSLPSEWKPYFVNANDGTNEGIIHISKPFFSVQFHPEAHAGPHDTDYLFDKFAALINNVPFKDPVAADTMVPQVSKVIILGSGGLSIGQAGEFDYSGSQAIKALKEEHIQTILINPNIATVQTTSGLADKIYFLPITPEFVIKIIEKEKPDGILVTFGGQTALNCGVQLHRDGILEKYNVKVLGTPIDAIIATEDRAIFAEKMSEIGEKIAESQAANSQEEVVAIAEKIGYPVILRAAYALGGLGSGFADNAEQLKKLAQTAFANSEQVLIEKSLKGWKEVEYEVVRDCRDNCITVTNMENFDPLGVHTGESIVIAPSQTLTDSEYNMLRDTSIKVIRHLGIVGECNIQFALDPFSEEYFIIEVNARLSRSSALASKATGYPLAFIAAKLSLGKELPILRNSVTKVSTACFEPSLDYVVVKMPLWDLRKFDRVDTKIGTSMKSVGEVMAIGRNFEEAIQKAIRSVDPSADGFQPGVNPSSENELQFPTDRRIYVLASALKDGMDIERIHELTKIDRWFLHKLKKISDLEKTLEQYASNTVTEFLMRKAKQTGFSDKQIARCVNSTELMIRRLRVEMRIFPYVKQIDTVAAEVVAQNNYLYTTYNGMLHDLEFTAAGYMVMGSGPYRIGSSVEFDWCAVGAIYAMKKLKLNTIMVNCNPETVSTDYDICDRLYFEELTLERILDIYQLENSSGVLISMGGQIPNNLALPLWRQNVNILGTSPDMIDAAENRFKFSRLLDSLGVDQPKWKELTDIDSMKDFCNEVSYPCLVRPSYVLSGAAMHVVHSETDLNSYLREAAAISPEHPVVISKFIEYAKEIEMDAVAKDGELIMHCISEHVENAGVHSGDATIVFPAQDLDEATIRQVEEATMKIAKALHVTGPFNVQFLAKDGQIKVIECNLRASRSFPFVSKTLGLSLIEMATKAIMGAPVKPYPVKIQDIPWVGVKVAQFSFSRLLGADPVLRVEMASTGEVGCFGSNLHEAFLKAVLSTGFRLPKQNIFLSIGGYRDKRDFLASATQLVARGYKLFGSPGTADFLSVNGIPITTLDWPEEVTGANSIEQQLAKNIDLCIICPSANYRRPASFLSRGYLTRRRALDSNVPLVTNIKFAKMLVHAFITNGDIHVGLPDVRNSRRIVVLPGLIDTHVHVREPGQTHKEDWKSCSAAALSGGITIIGAMPNTSPAIIDAPAFQTVAQLASTKSYCDYGLYVGASEKNATTLPSMAPVSLAMKMYLDPTFGDLKLGNLSHWMEHFQNWPSNRPICCHAEGQNLAAVILLSSVFHKPVHLCHVSRKDEIEIIRKAKEQGIPVTCEVTPHHLFLTEEDIQRLGPSLSQVRPQLTVKDRNALWENMDVIDCFATDHAPHTLEEKRGEKAPPGFPGLETSLALFLNAVHEGKLTLDDLIARMYTNPRKIFNLPEQPDTYVEVDLDYKWTIPDFLPFSKCKWTPFAQKRVVGKVIRVVLRGHIAYLDGKILVPEGFGKDLRDYRKEILQTSSKEAPPKGVLQSPPTKPTVSHLIKPTAKLMPVITQGTALSFADGPGSPSPPRAVVPPIQHSPSKPLPDMALKLETLDAVERSFYGKDILGVSQFTREHLHIIFNHASDMKLMVKKTGEVPLLRGKVLVNLFFEPSTRTSLSFAAAMERLGGSVLSVNQLHSSVVKGESLEDTVKTVECYSDVIVIRHPEAGTAQTAAKIAHKPVINAGDGIGEHPTQALLDVFTMREELGTVNGLTIALVGDLKHGRTVHSLVQLLSLYQIRQFHYVSPPSLRMPEHLIEQLKAKGIKQTEHTSLDEVIPTADVLYVTRVQKERFSSLDEYDQVKETYCITPKLLAQAKERMVVMHPLPRITEISTEVDADPRAAYFRQMENGMFVRMALLALTLGKV